MYTEKLIHVYSIPKHEQQGIAVDRDLLETSMSFLVVSWHPPQASAAVAIAAATAAAATAAAVSLCRQGHNVVVYN